jgi:hypothetical protein
MSRWTRHLLVVAAAAVVAVMVLIVPRVTRRDPHLPEPQQLSPTVRALLHERMRLHGHQMAELSWNVVKLDWNATRELAEEVAAEPRLARPSEMDATQLNSQLPERFFVLQDALRDQAQALARAAEGRDPRKLADAWSALSGACVSCHEAYLAGEPRKLSAR